MEKIAIHCKTQEEYNQLMEIYEKKGWKRKNGMMPKKIKVFGIYKELCVDYRDEFGHSPKAEYQKILTFNELLEMENQFKRGDKVLVTDSRNIREEKIYVTTIEGATYPYICVCGRDENRFKSGEDFGIVTWKQIKPLPTKKELTLQEIADKFGVKVEDLRVKD